MRYTILIELDSKHEGVKMVSEAIKVMGMCFFSKKDYKMEIVSKTEQLNIGELGKVKKIKVKS